MIDCVKIVYDKESCRKCGGQIMTIFVMKEIIYRKCIKCNNSRIRLVPECEEECLGRIMHIYNMTGHIIDKRW